MPVYYMYYICNILFIKQIARHWFSYVYYVYKNFLHRIFSFYNFFITLDLTLKTI